MKPESVKCLLNLYLAEKIRSNQFDDVDGIYEPRAQCSVEPFDLSDDRLRECTFLYPQHAVAVPQLNNAELSPREQAALRSVARQLSQLSDDFDNQRCRSASLNSEPENKGNSVQFKKRCIFVSPNKDMVQIIVERVGNTDEALKVKWETADKTAKSGVHYHENGGEVTFAVGESEKTIEVELIKKHQDKNISFTVHLYDPEKVQIASDNQSTVYIADHSNFVQTERQVVDNVMNCTSASVSEIAICLHDDLTVNTFRTTLQYHCSYFDSVLQELSFACELFRLSVGKAPMETLGEIVCQFFSNSPELEDISEAFK